MESWPLGEHPKESLRPDRLRKCIQKVCWLCHLFKSFWANLIKCRFELNPFPASLVKGVTVLFDQTPACVKLFCNIICNNVCLHKVLKTNSTCTSIIFYWRQIWQHCDWHWWHVSVTYELWQWCLISCPRHLCYGYYATDQEIHDQFLWCLCFDFWWNGIDIDNVFPGSRSQEPIVP